jgi:hypothetical protein
VFVETGVLHFRERLYPVQATTDARPEAVGIAHRLLIQALVIGQSQVGERGEIFRNFVKLLAHCY